MKKERRKFSAGFKAKVAIEAIKEQQTIQELAVKYELHPTQINTWKREFLANAEQVFTGEKKADLSDAIMVRYGKAIPYDFSIPYPELAKYFKNIPLFNDVKDDTTLAQKLQIIQDKYTELLEKHNMLLEENNELKYRLSELK
uniref:Transposase n=1 Tax=Sphingobacterium sp. (strain 21) TaxID=743722 RepID=F4CAE0_SPHS2